MNYQGLSFFTVKMGSGAQWCSLSLVFRQREKTLIHKGKASSDMGK
jgi:hypothetical protein